MIDFHQHVGHIGRSVEQTLAHQVPHGVRQSVLLPIDGTSTPEERFPWEMVRDAARAHADRFIPFVHVDPTRPDALEVIRRPMPKAPVASASTRFATRSTCPQSLAIYRLCGDLGLPVLLHFEYGMYNYNFEAFGDVVRDHPQTTFIGHAQAWWANISADAPSDPGAPGYTAYPRERCGPGA
jgi:predicted TIM-barrel fold metal-dependent hydrolase